MDSKTFQANIRRQYPVNKSILTVSGRMSVSSLIGHMCIAAHGMRDLTSDAIADNHPPTQRFMVSNMGEVLAMLSLVCDSMGITLEEVMHQQVHKNDVTSPTFLLRG